METTVAKVKDFPSLRKTGGFVINVNGKEFSQAKARAAAARKTKMLENEVSRMSGKIDEIMGLLTRYAEAQKV